MSGKHRKKRGCVTVSELSGCCDYEADGLFCVRRAGHSGWHAVAFPGTCLPRYFVMKAQVYITGSDA